MIEKNIEDLLELMTHDVNLSQDKFRDTDTNLPPDFMMSFSIRQGRICQSSYTPVLNHWGFDNLDYLTTGVGAIVLPWMHEDTWKYLVGKDEQSETPNPLVLNKHKNWNALVAGVRAGQIIFTEDPSAIKIASQVISGGTRTGTDKIKRAMKRPWQVGLPTHDLNQCPLCNRPQTDEVVRGKLKIFTNQSTPYNLHRMIIPTRAFYEEGGNPELFLYNPRGMSELVGMALEELLKSRIDVASLAVHQGYTAGQNLGHLHYHLVSS